jgi:hypothetical protein
MRGRRVEAGASTSEQDGSRAIYEPAEGDSCHAECVIQLASDKRATGLTLALLVVLRPVISRSRKQAHQAQLSLLG